VLPSTTLAVFQTARLECLGDSRRKFARAWSNWRSGSPRAVEYRIVYDTTVFVDESIHEVYQNAVFRGVHSGVHRRDRVPARLAGYGAAGDRRDCVADRHVRADGPAWLFAQQSYALRLGAGRGHCGRTMRSWWSRISSAGWAAAWPARATRFSARWEEITRPVNRQSRPCFVPCSFPPCFMAGISGRFYSQFALTIACSTIISAINSLTMSPPRGPSTLIKAAHAGSP